MTLSPMRYFASVAVLILFGGIQPGDAVSWQTGRSIDHHSQGGDEDSTLFEKSWQRINSLFETMDRNQLEPVVKQQFMLAAANACFEITGTRPPANLRHEVSTLKSQDEFRDWLSQKWNLAFTNDHEADSSDVVDAISRSMVRQVANGATFVSANENRVARQLAANQYVGIGIQVSWEDEKAKIVVPFPGGTAYKAGARPNDFILQVDEKSMDGLNLGEIVDVLRGSQGSHVSVVVQNKDGSDPRKLEMVREVIPIPSVTGVSQNEDGSWEFLPDSNDDFAYIKIASVVGSTSAELRDAARKVIDQGARGVILDLRQLADGDLHQIHLVADVLVSEGLLGTLERASGPSLPLETSAPHDYAGLPIAVVTGTQKVSGPVFVLLAALKNRPDTVVIGPVVTSNLRCRASFDLPENQGAIANLEYASVAPEFPGREESTNEQQIHVRGLMNGFTATLAPVIESQGEWQSVARSWLQERVAENESFGR